METLLFGVSLFFVLVSIKLAFGKPLSTVLFVRWALFRCAVLRGALFDPLGTPKRFIQRTAPIVVLRSFTRTQHLLTLR